MSLVIFNFKNRQKSLISMRLFSILPGFLKPDLSSVSFNNVVCSKQNFTYSLLNLSWKQYFWWECQKRFVSSVSYSFSWSCQFYPNGSNNNVQVEARLTNQILYDRFHYSKQAETFYVCKLTCRSSGTVKRENFGSFPAGSFLLYFGILGPVSVQSFGNPCRCVVKLGSKTVSGQQLQQGLEKWFEKVKQKQLQRKMQIFIMKSVCRYWFF